MKTGNVII